MYFCGQGLPQDCSIARQWFEKAAAACDSTVKYNLGVMYDKGRGMPRPAEIAVMKLPDPQEVPSESSDVREFRDFVDKYNPVELFQQHWGDEYAARADNLDKELTRQLKAGQDPQAPVEELLLCFCRMWLAAPYLGVDSVEEFLRNRRALWLLDGIRRHVESKHG